MESEGGGAGRQILKEKQGLEKSAGENLQEEFEFRSSQFGKINILQHFSLLRYMILGRAV